MGYSGAVVPAAFDVEDGELLSGTAPADSWWYDAVESGSLFDFGNGRYDPRLAGIELAIANGWWKLEEVGGCCDGASFRLSKQSEGAIPIPNFDLGLLLVIQAQCPSLWLITGPRFTEKTTYGLRCRTLNDVELCGPTLVLLDRLATQPVQVILEESADGQAP
ncbi:hypothetical protein PIB30_010919 [Stylosanthes scabra]|uniref:Uncharacterized protein n=1 Tax=Stylosanthes scabra TaxID=79078 RepID=A0ABU6T723_9FABA|nr:hypothetical protein [Stylosanthes scabra]